MKRMKRCRIYTADGLLVCDGTMKDCAAAIQVHVSTLRNWIGGFRPPPDWIKIEVTEIPLGWKPEKSEALCPCRCCLKGMQERCSEEDEPCARFEEWFCGRWRAAQEKLRRNPK